MTDTNDDFFLAAAEDLQGMEDAYASATENPNDSEAHIQSINWMVEALKGQAEEAKYPLLHKTAQSLYYFCNKHAKSMNADKLVVIRKHLDTIGLIIKDKTTDDGGDLGKELINSLQLLVQKYDDN